MRLAFLDLRAGIEECEPQLSAALARVRASGRFVLGPEVEAFEREFASACGTRHCVGVASGLDALALALRAWEIGPGVEVIVPAYTAVATWMAVASTGARPVGVDIDPETRTLDPALVEAAITPRTRALVPVHLFGLPADMDGVNAIAQAHGLPVLEDAAHAHGARWRGRRAGSLGAAGAFSFYPTKNLGALGDAGAVTTDDDGLAERVRMMRGPGSPPRGGSPALEGYSSRLDELQAAVLRVRLRHLERWNRRRAGIAARYLEALTGVAGVTSPRAPDLVEAVWHLFVIAVEDRDGCKSGLETSGIATKIHYDPLPHRTPTFRRAGWRPGDFPVAESLARRALSLPLYPQLSDESVDRVARQVGAMAAKRGRRPLATSR